MVVGLECELDFRFFFFCSKCFGSVCVELRFSEIKRSFMGGGGGGWRLVGNCNSLGRR